MMGGDEVCQLLHKLAAHPVVPSTDRLPPNNNELQVLLADLAAGERSRHADMLCSIATEHGITPKELAQRAEFLGVNLVVNVQIVYLCIRVILGKRKVKLLGNVKLFRSADADITENHILVVKAVVIDFQELSGLRTDQHATGAGVEKPR